MLGKITVAALALLWIGPASAGPDEDAIRHLLHATFDKPELRLVVDPVAVVGGHAVAGWSQGELGGRALMRRQGAQWIVVLCSGDGIRSADALRQAGLPPADATALARQLAEVERHLPSERLALLGKFDGTLMMDASGAHPAPHPHPAAR